MIKKAITKYAVDELIKNRWSPRSFADKEIPDEILLSLFEAASWAASSRNEQPWRFISGIKNRGENFQKIFNSLVEGNQRWAKSAPVLNIGVAKTYLDRDNQPNRHALYDLGQSMAMLSVQAISMNLYLHQMGGFVRETVKKEFNLPDGMEPVVAFAIGYLGKAANLPDDLREMEEKPRVRHGLSKIFLFSDFDL